MGPEELEAVGLGLPRGVVHLAVTDLVWSAAANQLIDDIARAVGDLADAVEHIGSTAVPGLLAKPIVDIAVHLLPTTSDQVVVERLEAKGWEFRGDAGGAGGLVFVLSVRPDHRVAHIHVVRHGDEQWQRYLMVRDVLRSDARARRAYEDVGGKCEEDATARLYAPHRPTRCP